MTPIEKKAGRPAPTSVERRMAAQVRVSADKRRKVDTPAWIRQLAQNA
jgi:hypothetical protein